jgi:hypothetical protein
MTNDDQVAQTGVVPWDTVTGGKDRRAFAAGQPRAAFAGLADDAPVVLHVATDDDDVADDQIIVSAGHGEIGWGDGYGLEPDPIFALECAWPTAETLHVRPVGPRRS